MTTKHIIVLGAGRVGAAMARDLAKDGEFHRRYPELDR